MGWIEFAASVIGSLLSWPVVVLVLVLVLLKPIRGLIGRIKGAKGFGTELEFNQGLEEAEESIDVVLETAPAPLRGQPPLEVGDEQPRANEPDATLPDPSRDPTGAILASWNNLLAAVTDLQRANAGRGRPSRNARIILDQLRRSDVVTKNFYDSALKLLELRNQVAHGEVVPTRGASLTYVERASQLERVTRGIIALGNIDLGQPAP